MNMFSMPSMAGNALGAGIGGAVFGPLGALAGAAVPHLAARAVVSAPVQRYLGNQALPQSRQNIVNRLLLQQAGSLPSDVARNAALQAEYEERRRRERDAAGLQ
jgi:hypothetical protein